MPPSNSRKGAEPAAPQDREGDMDATDIKIAGRSLPPVNAAVGKAIASNRSEAGQPAKNATPVATAPEVQRQIDTRSELDVNQTVERVISRVVDQSGSVVDQIPTEEELRLLERSRQVTGTLFNKSA